MSILLAFLFAGHLMVAAQPAENVSWEQLKERADSAFAEEEYRVAQGQYRKAIQAAKGASLSEQADLHNQLGRTLYEMDQLAEARKVYQRGLDLHSRAGTAETADAGAIWYNLGHVHGDMDQVKEAEFAYQRCAEIERAALGADSLELAVTLAQLGNYLANQKDYSKADQYLAEAAGIRKKQGDAQAGETLKDWAINRYRLSDYERAIALARDAIELSGEDEAVRGLSFNVIAMSHEARDEFGPAAANYRHALRLLRDALGFQDEQFKSVASNYVDLAIEHDPAWAVEAPE